jgi:hypothetical protein
MMGCNVDMWGGAHAQADVHPEGLDPENEGEEAPQEQHHGTSMRYASPLQRPSLHWKKRK